MNKKLTYALLGLFAVSLVSAVAYYQIFSVSVSHTNPIQVTGDLNPTDCGYNSCLGNAIIIENHGDSDRFISITDNADENLTVSYVGKMLFVQKNLSTWEQLGTERIEINYTVTGDNLTIKGIPIGFKLIYYPDTGEFLDNVASIVELNEGSKNVGSLPIDLDIGDDYCNNGFNPNAEVCRGAKLWLLTDSELISLKAGNWEATNFWFETDLITYTDSIIGEVLVPANSKITVYPYYEFDNYANGTYDLEITVA